MMDVIRCQEGKEEMNIKITRVRQQIESGDVPIPRITAELDRLDKQILEGDWGGYYGVRRPMIAQLDELRQRIGEVIPEREEEVWTRPAPHNMQRFTNFSSTNRSIRLPSNPFNNRPAPLRRAHSNMPSVTQPRNTAPSGLYLLPAGAFNNPECAICLDRFQAGGKDEGYTLCGHKFHGPCIRTWVRAKGGGAFVGCPLCKQNIMTTKEALLKVAKKNTDEEKKQEEKKEEAKPTNIENSDQSPLNSEQKEQETAEQKESDKESEEVASEASAKPSADQQFKELSMEEKKELL
mmetsp:Transcript_3898/g.5033  ORF Transcript_3898/g.5033 Transcript_3898/m.5033 type:complete len:293 (+) Transcript_3898:140-1018(+)